MDYRGLKVLVMGLGLHGGGKETARFLLKRGACVTVTDLRTEEILAPSIKKLDEEFGCGTVRYVLGKHEIENFKNADCVIKNPGVRPDSPFLQSAKRIETDISLFLSESPARLFAVTGSKGKSSAASALKWILEKARNKGKAFLGGNITVSPLIFLDELTEDDDVVLELSSWQLGDVKGKNINGRPLLNPKAAIITAIMPDHLDRYASMEEYVDDKKNIYRGQDEKGITIAGNDEWGNCFRLESKADSIVYSPIPLPNEANAGWLEGGRGYARLKNWPGISGETVELVPQELLIPGVHQKMNLLAASLAPYALGFEAEKIRNALAGFPGIEHRLEFFHEKQGIRFYNDSAATIPESAAACVQALTPIAPLILVTGGTDKNLNFEPLVKSADKAKLIILLAGSGSEKLKPMLTQAEIAFAGPFDKPEDALTFAIENAVKGDIIALSPGCASFEMFRNEFDRGNKWKELCKKQTMEH
jgi:UDP-N-acetylmuramoylalanine--D-glutamate ligase